MEDGGLGESGGDAEFEVEMILRYRKSDDGSEYFLVKWVGYPVSEATWEPLAHMNENCRELIAKARALFAFRKPAASPALQPLAMEDSMASPSPVAANAEVDAGLDLDSVLDDDFGEVTGLDDAEFIDPSDSGVVEGVDDVDGGLFVEDTMGADVNGRNATESCPPASKRPRLEVEDDEEPEQSLPRRPVVREMKCICGAAEKVAAQERDKLVVCRICNCGLHPHCVEGALQDGQKRPLPLVFVCPPCRLERVDEFHPPVGAGLLRHSYASSSSTFTLSFTSQASQWKKQQWAVHLRSVSTSSEELSGPAWPHRVQGRLNGRQCVVIDPPKHLHVRREQCYNLTPLLRQGLNQLELRFTPKPDRPRGEADENYCVGVVLTRPRSVASIIARIRTRSTETVSSGQQRVRRLIAQVARKERKEEECKVTGNFGRLLKPLCPVSLCPIEESAIGRHCNHIQVFDLQSYIAVNQRMRSLDKRWTCPVCSLALRPDDVVLDPFAQGILDTLRGEEESVEAVCFKEDCSWTTISAEKGKDFKEEKGGMASEGDEEGGANDGGKSAELIDLSDSE